MENLFYQYAQLQEKLKIWYDDSAKLDKEYTANFPTDGSYSEKIRYNESYQNHCKELAERWTGLREQLDQVEKEIHEYCPEFIPRKIANKR